ncbi:MAG: cell wall-binding repeat-containing protein [Lachnospiraceae bacterium]|nr:cell wall-binding repeat-containing protein [Lachnospiraceae bacterium]
MKKNGFVALLLTVMLIVSAVPVLADNTMGAGAFDRTDETVMDQSDDGTDETVTDQSVDDTTVVSMSDETAEGAQVWEPEVSEEALNGVSCNTLPLAGNDRYETARAAAAYYTRTVGSNPSTAVLVTGLNFPDALAANALAGMLNCPIILSRRSTLPESTRALLVNDWNRSVKTVYFVGAGFMPQVAEGVKACGVTTVDTTTYAGNSRYDTANRVCRALIAGGYTQGCMVATGHMAADALSASAWCYRLKMPILLAQKGNLSEESRKLAESFDTIYILGGTAVVSAETERAIGDNGDKCLRLSGGDRYETSVNIAAHFLDQSGLKNRATSILFARGYEGNFPDALVGGPAAAVTNAPVVLVRPTGLKPELVTILKSYMSSNDWNAAFVGAAGKDNSIVSTVVGQMK